MHAARKKSPWQIAVLLGGNSAEREISLKSGDAVASALIGRGHHVQRVDPDVVDLARFDFRGVACCFIALHGGAGEDGRVQRLLDARGVAYTGSGPLASRRAISKIATKQIFLQHGLPTPPFATLHAKDSDETWISECRTLDWPLIVKPCDQGSSLGVALARNPAELIDACRQCTSFGEILVVERYVSGRELTVAVLGREALPVVEIETQETVFNFAAKYETTDTRLGPGDDLPDRVLAQISELSVAAAGALGTSGLVRVDLRLDTLLRPWILELNTAPGLTARSLAPKAAAWAGIDLPTLCERMIQDGIDASGRDRRPRTDGPNQSAARLRSGATFGRPGSIFS